MFVYVISESIDGPCKIGYGSNPNARIIDCQIGNPRRLTLAFQAASTNPKRVEFVAHGLLTASHLGGEWFDVTVARAVTAIDEAARLVGDTPELVAKLMVDHAEKLSAAAGLHPRLASYTPPTLPPVLTTPKVEQPPYIERRRIDPKRIALEDLNERIAAEEIVARG